MDLILVTYNCQSFLRECLATLKEYTSLPYRLWIIDNHSTDQTVASLKRLTEHHFWRQRVKIIFNPRNLGLAKAWNLGIELGHSPYLVFINPDLKFTPSWLERLKECADAYPESGVVGTKVVDFNGRIDHFGFINGIVRGRGELYTPDKYTDLLAVDGIHGCCFLVKREIIPVVGKFDEQFFLYAEEDDYCQRVRTAGYQVILSNSVVYHFGSGCKMPTEERNRHHQESLRKFLAKLGRE